MRTLGGLITFLCGLVAIVIVFFGMVASEGVQSIPDFESTPREGWDYWMKKEYWADFRDLSMVWTIAICGVILPLMATCRCYPEIDGWPTLDWILLSMVSIYSLLPIYGLWLCLQNPNGFVAFPIILLLGCLYSLGIFWRRVRSPVGVSPHSV